MEFIIKLKRFEDALIQWQKVVKLIICYISSGATNIAEVSSGFHQADWSTTLRIVYCYPISFLFTCDISDVRKKVGNKVSHRSFT